MLIFALYCQNKGPILKYNAMKVRQILCLFFMIISGCNVNRICAQNCSKNGLYLYMEDSWSSTNSKHNKDSSNMFDVYQEENHSLFIKTNYM